MRFRFFVSIVAIILFVFILFNWNLLPIINNQVASGVSAGELFDDILLKLQETGITADINTEKAGQWEIPFYVLGMIMWFFTGFVGFLFFAQLILGALYWVLSGGNEEKIKKAQSQIYNAAIGITVFLAAYLLTSFMFKYFSSYLAFEISGF